MPFIHNTVVICRPVLNGPNDLVMCRDALIGFWFGFVIDLLVHFRKLIDYY